MPSHLSTIGFQVASEEELGQLAVRISRQATAMNTRDGRYLHWAGRSGEELWLQLDKSKELIGMNPHYAGKSRIKVRLTARLNRPQDTPLEGAFHGWANPGQEAEGMAEGDYPFVFDTPDSAMHSDLVFPAVVDVQIAAFAHSVDCFPNEEAFIKSQQHAKTMFAPRSFIPSGLFTRGGATNEPPPSTAIFTGQVIETEEKRNSISGIAYRWALVETLGGCFDVVIDPSLLSEIPNSGGFLSGSFWLSGRLLLEPRNARNWMLRLFRR
jgi:hypothetical protein